MTCTGSERSVTSPPRASFYRSINFLGTSNKTNPIVRMCLYSTQVPLQRRQTFYFQRVTQRCTARVTTHLPRHRASPSTRDDVNNALPAATQNRRDTSRLTKRCSSIENFTKRKKQLHKMLLSVTYMIQDKIEK